MEAPQYNNDPIESIDALSKILEIPGSCLIQLAEESERYYLPNPPKIKEDGTIRQTYTVREPLKTIQGRILNAILRNVKFPPYLYGGIKGTDYIADAKIHIGSTVIIHADISIFFNSIRASRVLDIWLHFFQFPPEVSILLTKLTTYRGFVPQGAKTSTYLANLVFWDREPKLVSDLHHLGCVYTRFVDDIQVSSRNVLTNNEKSIIMKSIYGMMRSLGFRPKRKKELIQNKSEGMQAHNLNLNSGRPTLPIQERKNIRAAVKELEELAKTGITKEEFMGKYDKVSGRIEMMAKFHPRQALNLRERMKEIAYGFLYPALREILSKEKK